MQLHNILITDSNCLSGGIQPTPQSSIVDLAGSSLTSRLVEFLASDRLPPGTTINLILDRIFIRYQYFSLPLISGRRIRQVLEFELDETLLKGSENYTFSYVSTSDKKAGVTRIGVYIIEKQLVNELTEVFKQFNLELRWITSLEHLMDLSYGEKVDRCENAIQVDIAENNTTARFFIYRKGFLAGLSVIQKKTTGTNEQASQAFIDQLNQKLAAIQLVEPDLVEIAVSGNPTGQIRLENQQFIEGAGDHSIQKPPALVLDHQRRINLIRSNLLIFEELKKHSRSLIMAATLLCCSLGLYLSAVAYRGYHDHLTIQTLETRMAEAISQYLPPGTSQSNALNILKEQVQNLESEKEATRKFEQHRYQVAKTLMNLSSLKAEIPSLTFDRFSLNEQVIRFQGEIASIGELDKMQEELGKLFPADGYRINTTEKSQGAGTVEFSTAIQQKQ